MKWYLWKFWRLAWSHNKGGMCLDGDGRWESVGGSHLYWLSARKPEVE